MKQFLSFVKKEFFHILRDRRTMLILLGIPIAQILLFGFAISTEVKNTQLAVLDLSKDAATRRIVDELDASQYFTLVETLETPAGIEEAFRNGRANLVVVFSENFQENLLHTGQAAIQLIADATDPNQASMIANYASGIISSYQQELMREHHIPLQINAETRMLYNPQMKSAYNFVPGVMGLILMLICAMMTSIAIVREKETGTIEVLLASPMRPIYIILAKAVPYFTLSAVNLATILLLAVFVLGVPIAGSLSLIVLLSSLFIITALAIGLAISNVVKTQVAAMLIAGMGLMMPTMLLSGMIFPIESMPRVLQWVSAILPVRWYIAAIRKLMIQGVDGIFVLKEAGILVAMTVLLIFVSLKNFKTRLE